VPGNPLWAAFSSTLGFAEFAATVFDHYHPSESFEPAERLGLQASACMSSELLAELRELRSELAQLSNRVLLLESQVTKTPNLRLSLRFFSLDCRHSVWLKRGVRQN